MRSRPPISLLWPALVAVLAMGITATLSIHEQRTQERTLRDAFDVGLRQTATRIEQRMTSYEQMLRGARGLFDASEPLVTRESFTTYVDALLAGADFAGLRVISYAPWLTPDRVDWHELVQRQSGIADYRIHPPGRRDRVAPVTYVAPASGTTLAALGYDPSSEPIRRAAMMRARDSGGAAITDRIKPFAAPPDGEAMGFLMFMPLYAKGHAIATAAQRRSQLTGWVFASFRIGDLMSSLYGEGTPGLDVRIYDGVDLNDEALMYPDAADARAVGAARFTAQEYIGFAGHTWTLLVRTTDEFEQRHSSDSAGIIAIAGSGLSLLLALLTWQLVTGRERAHETAREMTQQLRESAERYRSIVETANEGIWTVDAEARTTFVNPKMQQMLGYAADEVLGRPWVDFMDAAGRAEDTSWIERLGAGRAEQHDLRFRRKDGSDLWVSLSTSPIVDTAGQFAGALAMATDVTERKLSEANRALLEQQLRQSQKMEAIGTLAGGIAHDFNNILAAILGNVSLAREELAGDHPSRGRLEQIGFAGARARSLVQQIVAFSRLQPQERVSQPLRPVVEESVKLLRSMLPALVELEVRLADAPLQVDADATQLQQVLMNLCTNAWHALHGSTGRIVVGLDAVVLEAEAAERRGGLPAATYAHVWVSDNGSGMDEATRQRVFEPFYTTKPVGQGTGLGLAVVHGIVASHGGAITVVSTPGQGTTFDVYLPLVAPPTTPVPAPVAEPHVPAGNGQRVLYVDDDPVMLLMVEGLLQRAGYRVTCIGDPHQALGVLRSSGETFEVVVTDFNMPELSGIEFARELSRLRPGLPVVITSGYVSETMRAEAARAGVRHVLQKEFTLEQLGGLVHRALNER